MYTSALKLVLASAVLLAGAQFGSKQEEKQARSAIDKADRILQDLISDITPTTKRTEVVKDAEGREHVRLVPEQFGLARIPLLHLYHTGRDRTLNDKLEKLLNELRESDFSVTGIALTSAQKPVNPEVLLGARVIQFSNQELSLTNGDAEARALAVKLLESGKDKLVGTSPDRQLYLEGRVVRASRKDCLKCHGNVNLNDPMAVVVYAAKKTASPPPAKVSY